MQLFLSMQQSFQKWFNQLKRKEQYYLLVLAIVVIPYMVYILFIQPMTMTNKQLEQANVLAKEKLGNVQKLAAQYQQLKSKGSTSSTEINLPRLIDSSLVRHKLVLKRMQPSSSGDVQLRFENISFNQLLAWLYELESEYSVIVKDLSISPANDDGLISSSIRLRKG